MGCNNVPLLERDLRILGIKDERCNPQYATFFMIVNRS